jgi:transposase
MGSFPTADDLASWAGMCPGNNESAGQRRTGQTTRGSRRLRTTMVQAAWAARHTNGTYLTARDRPPAARRGKKPAPVVVGHAILVMAYQLRKDGTS